jgi:hypothetical protein
MNRAEKGKSVFKNQRTRDVDTGECLYYSSRSVAIQEAVQLIREGKRIAVESLTDKGTWICDLNECFTLEHMILTSICVSEQKSTMTSEIAHFHQQQALSDQAAYNGLYGYRVVARHDFIEARLEQGADRIVRLMQEGKTEQAVALMNAPLWGEPTVLQHIHGMISE